MVVGGRDHGIPHLLQAATLPATLKLVSIFCNNNDNKLTK
jgi:hypothetical protein